MPDDIREVMPGDPGQPDAAGGGEEVTAASAARGEGTQLGKVLQVKKKLLLYLKYAAKLVKIEPGSCRHRPRTRWRKRGRRQSCRTDSHFPHAP